MRQQPNRLSKWLRAAAALTLVAALAAGCGNGNKSKDVVATYKDGQITKTELTTFQGVSTFFNPYLSGATDTPEMQDMLLKQYAALKILSGRATDASKKDADTKTKTEMKSFDDYVKSQQEQVDQQMKTLKITRNDIQDYILKSYTVMADLDSKVTDQQLKDTYDQQLKNDPHAFDIATVSHILIGTTDPNTGAQTRTPEDALKRAQEVKTKLDQGGDFAALAKEYSDDPGSKDNGGTYENAPTSQWDPDFANAVSTLPLNKISDPVQTQFGYHIIKVTSRSVQKVEDVKDNLKSQVSQNMMDDFINKELPTLDFKSKLPQPSPSPSAPAAPAASTAPQTSPSAAPAASPAAK